MPPAKYPLLVIALCLSVSNFHFEASGDVIPQPTDPKCESSCQQLPPPSGYPYYGAPPPPSPSGYSIYYAPPPPPLHKEAGDSKCPPGAGTGVQSPPVTYYPYAPPNPYTYVPYGEVGPVAPGLLPILAPLMMLFSSFIFLF